ncbi:MAG TPA: carbonate dehydratase [Fimbriimonas sp.]|nr:carbonate dehydratase [Fimbriimonas sp.]
MNRLADLLENNREWARTVTEREPGFFDELAKLQTPRYLWIGCSDSRVPANQIVGQPPGEVFVHRNIANLVIHTDLNCLSVMQFAVDVLEIKDIIVCGHYGCGGVLAAMNRQRIGLADNWLRHIIDVHEKHKDELDAIEDEQLRHDRLCELNVMEQVANVCQSSIVYDAWSRGKDLAVHGWIYSLADGLLRDLKVTQEGLG